MKRRWWYAALLVIAAATMAALPGERSVRADGARAENTQGECPRVGDAASPEGFGVIVSSEPVVENGAVVRCIVRAEGQFDLPATPVNRALAQQLLSDPATANPAAAASYYEAFCNVEVAGHEQFHIEMFDQHLHQRYWYDGSTDALVWNDGAGGGGGRKTVQWWTDRFWGGSATWSSQDYGATAWGLASGAYNSFGIWWANIWEQCEVRADGSSTAYWQVQWNPEPFWHIHPRSYGGWPPDW